jgi:ribosomal protein S18 acetylase RimI-like enzyme
MMSISIRIRQYQQADQAAVMKLHIDGLNQFGASIGNPLLDKDIQQIEQSYLNNNGDFLVGLLDNRIIGMGAFRKYDRDTAEIKRIRIAPEHQKRGIGPTILTALEQAAQQKGYKRLVLDTTSKQLPAQKLFERNGYIETSRTPYKELELIFYQKMIAE